MCHKQTSALPIGPDAELAADTGEVVPEADIDLGEV
jgi:hypothetical protein